MVLYHFMMRITLPVAASRGTFAARDGHTGGSPLNCLPHA
jgi:hypothetical protein